MRLRYDAPAEGIGEDCLRAVMSAALGVNPDTLDRWDLWRGDAAVRAALPYLTIEVTR